MKNKFEYMSGDEKENEKDEVGKRIYYKFIVSDNKGGKI
jgi:hypothetical protein